MNERPHSGSKRRYVPVLLLALMAPLALAGLAIADSGGRSDAAKAQSATAKYHDLQRAIADGYGVLPAVQSTSKVEATNGCASSKDGLGAMGVHYIHPDPNNPPFDDKVDAQHPEVLVYEPQANGNMKLVALEYVSTVPQTLFGQAFAKTDLAPYVGGQEGTTFAWTLHAWIWDPNPTGALMPWNPRVTCDNA
jgi:hypothetical protein